MKPYFILCFFLISTEAYCQYKLGKELIFKDTTRTPLEFISNQFNDRAQSNFRDSIQSPLDTSCLYATGTVKFTVHHRRIDQVFVSVGIPDFVAVPLKDAIESSVNLWELTDKTSKGVTVLIPFLILPSSLCKSENYRDERITTMANMLTYEGKYDQVGRNDYLKKAKGAEQALILPILLIRSTVIDVYKPGKYVK